MALNKRKIIEILSDHKSMILNKMYKDHELEYDAKCMEYIRQRLTERHNYDILKKLEDSFKLCEEVAQDILVSLSEISELSDYRNSDLLYNINCRCHGNRTIDTRCINKLKVPEINNLREEQREKELECEHQWGTLIGNCKGMTKKDLLEYLDNLDLNIPELKEPETTTCSSLVAVVDIVKLGLPSK